VAQGSWPCHVHSPRPALRSCGASAASCVHLQHSLFGLRTRSGSLQVICGAHCPSLLCIHPVEAFSQSLRCGVSCLALESEKGYAVTEVK